MDLRYGRGRYFGFALLALAALWTLGVLPQAPRLVLSDGKPWAQLRNPDRPPTRLETRLGNVAGTIAGRTVGVRCEDLGDIRNAVETGGVVQFSGDQPANYTRIRPNICRQLQRIQRDGGGGGGAEASAADVLAHESFHLRGVKDEATAECYAIQFIPEVARELGATPANAQVLHWRAVRAYPFHPPDYVSRDCRAGGRLDLHGRLPPD